MQNECDERKQYEQTSERQYHLARKIQTLVFCSIGLLFLVLAAVLYGAGAVDEKGFSPAYIFAPMGAFWVLLGAILYFVLPKKGNYDRYQARVQKGNITNTNDMAMMLSLQQKRIEALENRIAELEKKSKAQENRW